MILIQVFLISLLTQDLTHNDTPVASQMSLTKKEYSRSDGFKRLEEVSRRQLRGYTGEDENINPLESLSVAREVLQAHVNHVTSSKEKILNSDDKEEALAVFNSYIGDTRATAKQIAAREAYTEEDRRVLNSLSLATGKSFDHQDISSIFDKEELSSFMLDDEIIDNMQYTLDTFEKIENDIAPLYNNHHRRTTSKNTDQQKHFKHFQPNSHFPDLSFGKKGHIKFPKLKVVEQLKAQKGMHGQRRLQTKPSMCPKPCDQEDVNDYKCNCERLRGCANELTYYDLAVKTLGGYVSAQLEYECIVYLFLKSL